MSATYSCDINTLLQLSACYSPACLGQPDREAIEIYVAVQELAAAGGTDYTGNIEQLLIDSSPWTKKSAEQIKQVELYQGVENAINAGASVPTDINELKADAKCFLGGCLGKERQRGIHAFLKCALGTRGFPDS